MNYYNILSVSNTASDEEIEIAYKKAIKTYHPDNYTEYKGVEEEFGEKVKQINEAYDVLKDKEKRKQYDEDIKLVSYYKKEYDNNENISDQCSFEDYIKMRNILKQNVLKWMEKYK